VFLVFCFGGSLRFLIWCGGRIRRIVGGLVIGVVVVGCWGIVGWLVRRFWFCCPCF